MGAGEEEKERAMRGQRGVSRKLRELSSEAAEGSGVCASLVDPAFRCIQAELLLFHSQPQPPRPLFVIWIPSPSHADPTSVEIHLGFGQSRGTYPQRMSLSSC